MFRSILRFWAGRSRLSKTKFALLLALAAAPALAHHSIAQYDLVHGTILEGVVAGFEWENPHAHIRLDVANESETEHWTIQLESPSVLRRLGWNKDTVKKGDRISVTGARAKNGAFDLRAAYIELAGGRKLLALPQPEL